MKMDKILAMPKQTRREWLLTVSRISIAAIMGIGAFRILRRNPCPENSCSGCPAQGNCERSEAMLFRQQVRKQGVDNKK
jgi:hypothetical protein